MKKIECAVFYQFGFRCCKHIMFNKVRSIFGLALLLLSYNCESQIRCNRGQQSIDNVRYLTDKMFYSQQKARHHDSLLLMKGQSTVSRALYSDTSTFFNFRSSKYILNLIKMKRYLCFRSFKKK